VNDAPIGVDDEYTVFGSDPFVGDVSINDLDADNDTLTFGIVSDPINGVVDITTDGGLTYTANSDYFGADSLAYSLCDTTGLCDTVWVYLNIIDPSLYPGAIDDSFEMNEDEMLDGTVATNDLTLDTLDFTVTVTPGVGDLIFNQDGSFSYTPPVDFNGQVTFEYMACDTANICDTAIVVIAVWPINDAPIAADDNYTITQDATLEDNVMTNDTDVDNEELTVALLDDVSNGTLTLDADGNFSYVPEAGFLGADTFSYVLCDTALCDTAIVIITITEIIPIPDAIDDSYVVMENSSITDDVSLNDVDTEGLDYSVTTQPMNGTVVMTSDGTFIYTPNSGFIGMDSFTYVACDELGNCYEAVVTITIEDDPSNNDVEIHVPGGFSPNGDDVGDTFIIENIELYPNNKVQIFNRWGNVVYKRDAYSNTTAWDGTTEAGGLVVGELVPEGTYFYILEKGDGSAALQGFIVIKYEQN
jgi:gliding motility-associated-like protein